VIEPVDNQQQSNEMSEDLNNTKGTCS